MLPLVLVTGIAGTASAYWSSSGTGSGTASTATLNPPTALSAANIPGSGTVSLAWTGSSGLAPEGYYVTRTRLGDGVTAPACDSSPTGPLITSTTCDDTSVPAGTYNYTATAVYRSWAATGTASSAVVVTPDTTAPDVESILRAGASQAVNGGPLSWTVTFSEPVTGVSAANFSLTSAGLDGADPTIGIPTPSGDSPSASWTVSTTMAGTTGANGGSIRLDLADPTGIVDAVGNSLLPGSFTGQAYTYDTTAPAIAVTSVNGAAPTTFPFTSAATVTTFGGSCGAATGDTAEVRPRIDGAPTSPATVPCSGGFWEVTLAPALAVNGTWSLSAIQGDAAGNTGTAAPRTLTIATPAPTVTAIDRASGAPALVNAGPLTWTVTFSSPVSGVTESNFALATSGLGDTEPIIGSVTPSGGAPSAIWTVTVTMAGTTGTDAGTIGLDLTRALGIVDGSGNAPTTASFQGPTYVFDTTAPS